MSDSESGTPPQERRARNGLRMLIDEMMAQLRSAAGHDVWTPEERQRAEADLARIMDQVRDEAMGGPRGGPGA